MRYVGSTLSASNKSNLGAQFSFLGLKKPSWNREAESPPPFLGPQSLLINIPSTGPNVAGVSLEVGDRAGPGQAVCLWWPGHEVSAPMATLGGDPPFPTHQ